MFMIAQGARGAVFGAPEAARMAPRRPPARGPFVSPFVVGHQKGLASGVLFIRTRPCPLPACDLHPCLLFPRVENRGCCLPFERVESDSPEAADRVSQVLRRAQRASLPLLLD